MLDWFIPVVDQQLDGKFCIFVRLRTHSLFIAFFGSDNQVDILQRDGAAPHCSHQTLSCLYSFFPFIITRNSRDHDLLWAPYSPDLNPCDFFLWGHMKNTIHKKTFQSYEEMKHAVIDFFDNLPQTMINAAIESFPKRLQLCKNAKGKHFKTQ